jgi:hypothetical protein
MFPPYTVLVALLVCSSRASCLQQVSTLSVGVFKSANDVRDHVPVLKSSLEENIDDSGKMDETQGSTKQRENVDRPGASSCTELWCVNFRGNFHICQFPKHLGYPRQVPSAHLKPDSICYPHDFADLVCLVFLTIAGPVISWGTVGAGLIKHLIISAGDRPQQATAAHGASAT